MKCWDEEDDCRCAEFPSAAIYDGRDLGELRMALRLTKFASVAR